MQLDDLLLHENDNIQLKALIQSGTQSMLLESERGYGKSSIATLMAMELVDSKSERIVTLEPAETSITIEQVRSLKNFFSLKTHINGVKRVALIVDADTMTVEAQNSLLKLLEEPPEHCHLILTSSHAEFLLPTILSRVQVVHLRKQTHQSVADYFVKKGFSSLEIKKAMATTDGLVGITSSVLNGEATAHIASLDQAKLLLGSKHVDRLKAIDGLSKNKQSTLMLLDAFKTIATVSIRANAKGVELWKTILHSSTRAEQQLAQNANTKLVLTNLFLSL